MTDKVRHRNKQPLKSHEPSVIRKILHVLGYECRFVKSVIESKKLNTELLTHFPCPSDVRLV